MATSIASGGNYSKFSNNQHSTVSDKLLSDPQVVNREATARHPLVM